MFELNSTSLKRLQGVHPDLVRVVKHAIEISPVDFVITEGLRGKQRQEELVKKGASQTLNSRHLTGHAIDVAAKVEGEISWNWAYYTTISKAMKQAAKELEVPIVWGGDWTTLKDGCHFELDRKKYG